MARKGRLKSNLGIYHAVLRGQRSLFTKEEDYIEFKKTLERYFFNTDSQIYAYSLEKNKVHLVFFTPDDISDVMKPLLTSYARYVNRTYNKNGKLFYDRYMSEPIEEDELLKKAVIFVNERKKAIHTSKEEYLGKAELCAVSRFGKKDLQEIKNPTYVFPFIDDYANMSDAELKNNILTITKENKDKEEILGFALMHSNLSKVRVQKLLNMKKVSKPKPVEKKKEEEPVQYKKKELSVWLL